MRAVLLIIIVAIVAITGAVATGFIDVRQIRGGQPPAIIATRSSISAKGGQAPAFDVQAGSVKVGSKQAVVQVPTLEVQKPPQHEARSQTADQAATNSKNAM